MQNVTIHYKNKPSQVIPVANLQRTINLMQNEIKKIDYGNAPVPATISESKPDKAWKKKKLLKYARAKEVKVQDNDTKKMIIKAIGNG